MTRQLSTSSDHLPRAMLNAKWKTCSKVSSSLIAGAVFFAGLTLTSCFLLREHFSASWSIHCRLSLELFLQKLRLSFYSYLTVPSSSLQPTSFDSNSDCLLVMIANIVLYIQACLFLFCCIWMSWYRSRY